jgi:hypothetical protein
MVCFIGLSNSVPARAASRDQKGGGQVHLLITYEAQSPL